MISFVVTTIGESRVKQLKRLLGSIGISPLFDAEIILVSQSEYGRIPQAISELAGDSPHVKLVPAPFVSCSRARNIGMTHATGDLVAFPDDDCWYPPGLIPQVLERFANSSLVGLCVRLVDPVTGHSFGRTRRPGVSFPVDAMNVMKIPISAGIFVRRAALDVNAVRFDERFGAGCNWGSGEETDLIHRLLASGNDVVYDGSLSVHHEAPIINRAEARKSYRYAVGFGALACKFLRARTFAHLPFVCIALFRAAGAGGLNLAAGRWARAYFYFARFAGTLSGATQGARAFLGGS